MEQSKFIKQIYCKDCNDPIQIEKEVQVGEIIECPNCGAEMEVVNLEPIEVSLIEEEK